MSSFEAPLLFVFLFAYTHGMWLMHPLGNQRTSSSEPMLSLSLLPGLSYPMI